MKVLVAAVLLAVPLIPAVASDCNVQPSDVKVDENSPLFSKLATVNFQKDQFETEEQYKSRLAAAAAEAMPELRGAIVAITTPAANAVKYDAERQRLAIPSLAHERYALGSIKPFGTGKGYHGGYIYRLKTEPTSYSAQNGFGANAEIFVTNYRALGFAWDPKDYKMGNNGSLGSPNMITLDLPPAEARELSRSATYVVRARVAFPYVFKENMAFGSPTFSNPTETRQTATWFFLEPVAVCLIAGDRIINQWEITRKASR